MTVERRLMNILTDDIARDVIFENKLGKFEWLLTARSGRRSRQTSLDQFQRI
jgi:hypothetical protein